MSDANVTSQAAASAQGRPVHTEARIHLRVPASSANLGPGYDSFGLALGKYDEVIATRLAAGLRIQVEGVGADTVPSGERHLVYQAVRRACGEMGVPVPGLDLRCINRIPHGGGQGSSASAIVTGIVLAREVVDGGRELLSDDDVFALATDMEGHPDNVAPALYGGFTVAWMSGAARTPDRPQTLRLHPHPDVQVVTVTASASYATSQARAALPDLIPHAEAAANTARGAVLVHALTTEPDLIFEATCDFLHQRYREAVMPEAAALLTDLRSRGYAAVLSGAGPSLLVMGTDLPDSSHLAVPGFVAERVEVPRHGITVDGSPALQ